MVNVRTVVEDRDNDLRKHLKATWPQVIQAGLKTLAKKRGTNVRNRAKNSK